jgi:hypothetical protein
MRFKEPKEGETRKKCKFLWFPKTIGKETRWLELALWEEEYKNHYGYNQYQKAMCAFETWTPTKWIEK